MSERRACRVIGCVRMTVRYRSRRIGDAGLRERLRTVAEERRRFGYRRLHVLLPAPPAWSEQFKQLGLPSL